MRCRRFALHAHTLKLLARSQCSRRWSSLGLAGIEPVHSPGVDVLVDLNPQHSPSIVEPCVVDPTSRIVHTLRVATPLSNPKPPGTQTPKPSGSGVSRGARGSTRELGRSGATQETWTIHSLWENGHTMGVVGGTLLFCRVCGAFGSTRLKELLGDCQRSCSRSATLNDLLDGRHPVTKQYVGVCRPLFRPQPKPASSDQTSDQTSST